AFADAVAARLDAAAVQIDEPPHERQPDAEPADETLAALRALIELVEDPRQVFARNADAAVLDADPNVLRVAPRRDAHRARALGEFRSVRQQVREHLRQPDEIPVDEDRLDGQ